MGPNPSRIVLSLGVVLAFALIAIFLFLRGRDPGAELDTATRVDRTAEPRTAEPQPTRPRESAEPDAITRAKPAAEPDADPATQVTHIDVLHTDGAPAPGMFVVVIQREACLDHGETDEAGRFSTARLDVEAGRLLVAGRGTAPVVVPWQPVAGVQRVRLPEGGTVAGIVKVDGYDPVEPVRLFLRTARERSVVLDIPPAAARLARELRIGISRLDLSTDADGGFRFSGLPPEWSGQISWTYYYELAESGDEFLNLDEARDDVVLELHRRPVITGRVVDAQDGEPVPDILVDVSRYGASTGSSTNVRLDGESRFRIHLVRGLERVRLVFKARKGMRLRTVDVEQPLDRDRDLGDIVLNELRDVAFRVIDGEGTPLAGAIAMSEPPTNEEGQVSARTDSDGQTSLRLPMREETVRLGKLGYRIERVEISPYEIGPITVRLTEPDQELTIELRTPSGGIAQGLRVRLGADVRFLSGREGMADTVYVELGASEFYDGFVDNDGTTHLHFDPDREGRVRIAGVLPDVVFRAEAVDQIGRAMASEEVSLSPGESRHLTLVIDDSLRDLRGVVRAQDGEPVSGARIIIAVVRWQSPLQTASDKDGNFVVRSVYGERVPIEVSAAGFVTFEDTALMLPADPAEPVVIVLERDTQVAVHIVDADGRYIPPPIRVTVAEFPNAAVVRRDKTDAGSAFEGWYEVSGVPPAHVTIRAHVGCQVYEIRHDTSVPQATIEIPRQGGLQIDWQLPIRERTLYRLRLVSSTANGVSSIRQIRADQLQRSPMVSMPALLPGSYELTLEEMGETMVYAPLREGIRVEITAGERTDVVLRDAE